MPTGPTRTSRYLGGLVLGVANQVLTMLVGLWLTRFALDRVGQAGYGLWLVALQIAAYLALADIGVAALLPRETALATGRAQAGGSTEDLARLATESRRLILWQTPLVALAALVVWLALPEAWSPLRPALAPILAVFVLGFPMRVFAALLQGLQDLAFLGWLQLGVWLVSTALVVALLLWGWRLGALAAGWCVSQLATPAVCYVRLRARFPSVLPARRPGLTWQGARALLSRSVWVSVGQVAGLFLNGAEILLIGSVLGPAAVVPYSCTAKLLAVAANLPMMVAHTAGPGLSEVRTAESRERLRNLTAALTQAVLLPSGLVACVVMAANTGFVTWWVGAERYGGLSLTVLLIGAALLRHWSTTIVYALFSFGHERRLALIGLGEGIATVALTAALLSPLGILAAPVGALAGVLLVTLPQTLPMLGRETGARAGGAAAAVLPWAARVAPALAVAFVLERLTAPIGFGGVVAASLGAAAVYAALLWPLARRPPLRAYVDQALAAVRPLGPSLVMRRGADPT